MTDATATERHAAAMAALKQKHKEDKQQLKQQLALEIAKERAEARRQDDRRNYLLGQALRCDRSEAAMALVAIYAERLTHPLDRKLFELPPLPAPPSASRDGDATPAMGEAGDRDRRNDDPLSVDAGREIPNPSGVGGRRNRSEATASTGSMEATSQSSPIHEGRADDALDAVPPDVKSDRSDALISGPDERVDVAFAPSATSDEDADPDRDGAETSALASTADFGDAGDTGTGTRAQAADPTAPVQVSIAGTAARPSFGPRTFLSRAELKNQIDETGAKRSKSVDGRWIATASTPEQADKLEALKLQPYEPK